MPSTQYYCWNPRLYFELLRGGPANFNEEFRRRTLKITLVDRVRKFDTIEWELDNSDGMLTLPEYLALGILVRVRLGYPEAGVPWRTFVINRIRGNVGVRSRCTSAHARSGRQAGITYSGRNRNAKAPKTAQSTSKKKGTRYYGSTTDISSYDQAIRLQVAAAIPARRTSEAIRSIAYELGFDTAYCLIEDTPDKIEAVSVPPGQPIGLWLAAQARKFGYVFRIDDAGFHFHSHRWSGVPTLRRAYDYGGSDVLELGIDGDLRLPIPKSVQTKGLDHLNREVVVVGAHSGQTSVASMFLKNAGALDSSAIRENLSRDYTMPVFAPAKVASTKAVQAFVARQLQSYKILLTVVGDPAVMAGFNISINGAGTPLIDGTWYAEEVHHIFDGTDYKTKLVLKMPPKHTVTGVLEQWVEDPKGTGGVQVSKMSITNARAFLLPRSAR